LLRADFDKRDVLKVNAAIGRMLKLTACKIVPDSKTCKEVMAKIIKKTKIKPSLFKQYKQNKIRAMPSATALLKRSNLTSKNNVSGIIRRKIKEAKSLTNELFSERYREFVILEITFKY
tara:strand:+ start:8622 stop:8978 length:357 start_codon:yes stop_codon:yes gene_type:complete